MAFSFFKTKKPIETRRQQRDALAARLSAAEADEARAREACTVAAVEGVSDAELAKVEFAKRQADDRVQSLASALQEFDAEIDAQSALEAAAADRKVREATASDLRGRADKIEDGLTPLLDAVRNSAAAIETSRPIVGEIGMFELFHRLEIELPPAFALIAGELRARAQMTLDGRAPAILPALEPPPVAAKPIPRQTIFLLKDAKWRNPERPHEFELAERFSFASVPVELARKALERGDAVPPESEQAQKLKYNKRGCPPLPEKCVDLDTGEVPKPPAGIVPWDAFARIDRGSPTRMRLAPLLNFEPAAARQTPLQNNESDHE